MKDQYQMPSVGILAELVAKQQLDNQEEGPVLFTSKDMGYAYGQEPLDKETVPLDT